MIRRFAALAITIAIHLLVGIALFIRWQAASAPASPTGVMMVEMLPQTVDPSPEPPDTEAAPTEPLPPTPQMPRNPPEQPLPPTPVVRVVPNIAAEAVEIAPTAAAPLPPTTPPPPPAPRSPRSGPDSWEGRVLSRLEAVKRYPSAARTRRVQGVVHVRFRVNRAGAVLFASVERGSGNRILDAAALDTIRRAQPLPSIPDDRPQEIEIVVPVEFYLR